MFIWKLAPLVWASLLVHDMHGIIANKLKHEGKKMLKRKNLDQPCHLNGRSHIMTQTMAFVATNYS
jgi:hypothetical protein